jgi:type I restriction enzyme, R subunit
VTWTLAGRAGWPTRAERAEHGAAAIETVYEPKLAAFLTFVLGQYVDTSAEELDRSRLPDYLKLKFGNPAEGVKALGGINQVNGSFIGFQKYLYSTGST